MGSREPGCYWVRRYGRWTIAKYDPEQHYSWSPTLDDWIDCATLDDTAFEAVGPKIEPPAEV